jgi:transmembrane 9 superfamily protein 2/4
MRGTSSYLLGGALLAFAPSVVNAFYLPGAAPHNYDQGDPVNVYVNALTPMLTGSDDSKLVWCSL